MFVKKIQPLDETCKRIEGLINIQYSSQDAKWVHGICRERKVGEKRTPPTFRKYIKKMSD